MADQEFFQRVAEIASQIIKCETCKDQSRARNSSGVNLGKTQPGWVGPEYQPGQGVVVVLQNPGVGGIKRDDDEVQYQTALSALSDNPTADEYMQFLHVVLGMVPNWRMWKRHVSSVVEGCLSPRQIAWLNAVKFRTPDNAALKANEKRHGRQDHLKQELQLLQPLLIVTIGEPAREAIVQLLGFLPDGVKHEHLAMMGVVSSKSDAHKIRDQIRRMHLCREESRGSTK